MNTTPSVPNLSLAPSGPNIDVQQKLDHRKKLIEELRLVLQNPSPKLEDHLMPIIFGGGVELFRQVASQPKLLALPLFGETDHFSGYNYCIGSNTLAELRFGVASTGHFVWMTRFHESSPTSDPAPYEIKLFLSHGEVLPPSPSPVVQPTLNPVKGLTEELIFEPECPILNHLYSVLSTEYQDTQHGTANTKRIHTIEQILRRIQRVRKMELSVSRGILDPSIKRLEQKVSIIEMDPVLNWKERFKIFKKIQQDRSLILNTKQRAHRKNYFLYQFPIHLKDMALATRRFFKRPLNNFLGLLERIFLDPPRWFLGVVRNNMGYSIAMGIYSPFTFFFITQPMNPHATWAAGKLRSAYIDTTESVKSIFQDKESDSQQPAQKTMQGTGSTGDSSAPPSSSSTGSSAGSSTGSSTVQPGTSSAIQNAITASFAGMVVSTDSAPVNQQTWDERMSNFKAMEMAFESNLEIAPRFGRLEQMETQLNWPLIMESTWNESDRYLDQIAALESKGNELKPEFKKYLSAERDRTQQLQMYLWDRNVRFILDHPYTLMNQAKDQTQVDVYTGRAFVLLREMTQTLANRYGNLKLPAGFEKIDALATHFESDYKNGKGMFDRLKKNSKLFSQLDPLNTNELREYMRRQWEILYLLENRAQEASNFGLKVYVWSVRNAVYLSQSFLNAKREELNLITPYLLENKSGGAASVVPTKTLNALKKIDSQYESLFHMMVLEFASIKKELGEHLKQDLEAKQRQTLIASTEMFLKERESLLKSNKLL
jgi:hypothetical protein